jgi:hypothetical protein
MIFDTSTQYSFFEVKYEHEAFVSVEQLVRFIKLFPFLCVLFLAVHVSICIVLSLCLLCIEFVAIRSSLQLSSSEDGWGM